MTMETLETFASGVNWRLLHSLDLDRVIREGDVDMIQAPAEVVPWASCWHHNRRAEMLHWLLVDVFDVVIMCIWSTYFQYMM